jgi:hypothetical protein
MDGKGVVVRKVSAFLVCAVVATAAVRPADWPQWRGG